LETIKEISWKQPRRFTGNFQEITQYKGYMNITGIKRIVRPIIILLLVAGIIFSATGRSDRFIGKLGTESLSRSNDLYLQASFDRALKGFLAMSALKMGLAVIKDSEAGISVGFSTQLHIGGLVQSVYDYVDIAWKTLLAGSGILLGMRYILDALSLVDSPSLALTLAVLLAMLALKWYFPSLSRSYRLTRDLALIMTIITLSIYLVVPLSIFGASFLSKQITAPSIIEAHEGVNSIKLELFPESSGLEKGIYERLRAAKEQLEEVALYFKIRAKKMTVWIIKIITGYVFDCIVFPLSLFVVLFWLLKSSASYVFGINREEDFRKDLHEMLSEYKGRASSPIKAPLPGDEKAGLS
ncbi:MAG: hypothetical protein RQ824_09370, partial [bacterium]|nr:hypothetical protein [bacterium]